MSDVYEVYAVKYGEMKNRPMSENFIGGDPHDTSCPLDYFVWAIVGKERTFIVDTGFDHQEAAARGRELQRLPKEGLAMIGVDAARVEDVIVSHLHYDHAGTLGDFPNARFHLQDSEMEVATGRCMCHEFMRKPYSVEHVVQMVRKVYAEQVVFHDGDQEIAPGISVHLCSGHAKGLMSVRVKTRRGYVMVASDATHFYMNFEDGKPFPIVWSVGEMIESWQKLKRLGDSDKHVVPGHDPLVLKRYPAASSELEGIVASLHENPTY